MWTLDTQLALVAIIVAIATTVALLLRSRRPLYVRFAAFAISIAGYYLTVLVTAVLPNKAILDSSRILTGSACVITATLFFDSILGDAGLLARQRRRKTTLAAIAMAVIGVTPLAQQMWAQASAASVAVILLGLRANAVLNRAKEVESAAERTRLRYLAFGGFGALFGLVLDFAFQAHLPAPPLGGLAVAIYLYFISQALMVRRLLDLHELLGKALVFGTLALILAVVYGLLVVWVGERRGLFLFNTLIASGLILILFEPLKTYLEETTTRVFFREHVTFARTMRKLARKLATVIELPVATELVLDRIYEAKRATHVSLYLLESDRMGFVLQGHRGPGPRQTLDGRVHPGLFAHITRVQTPLLRESVQRRLIEARTGDALTRDLKAGTTALAQDEALLIALKDVKADLVVPLRASQDVVGLLCLMDERLSEAYSSDEIAALMQVGEQLAINVENSRLFGLLRERDRLATLGEMSAGLAHEIRNPLAAIKAAVQELDPSHIDEGEDQELYEIILAEVDRLNTVVSQFLDYSRPFRSTFSPLAPNDAVRRTVQLMARDLGDDVEVELDLEEEIPDIHGDAEQLQQVLINLILNAAEAMSRRGKIEVSTRISIPREHRLLGNRDENRSIEIRVRDYGPGIPQTVRKNLFIPFFTTKERGTGLGLALCQRIVQHHGGSIEVQSVEGKGASFVIRLPVFLHRQLHSATEDVKDVEGALVPTPTPRLVPQSKMRVGQDLQAPQQDGPAQINAETQDAEGDLHTESRTSYPPAST